VCCADIKAEMADGRQAGTAAAASRRAHFTMERKDAATYYYQALITFPMKKTRCIDRHGKRFLYTLI
jgi:hypothetical protein